MTSRQVRNDLYQTLQIDLIGPNNGHEFERELLPETPTGWWLISNIALMALRRRLAASWMTNKEKFKL
ncbi:MAG: hypothetical protein R3F19_12850 [Verrucomicrobiales bacterium]